MSVQSIVAGFVLFALVALPAFPQGERATVTGTVTDASGAVIPGANVTIRNTATNVQTRTPTNAAGIYYLPALPPGTYDLTVESTNFRASRVNQIPLEVGMTATVDVILQVGTVAETVEVQATAVQLEAQTSGLGKSVETRKVHELPILGRDPLALAALAPGVIPMRGRQGAGSGVVGRGTNARVSGGLNAQNAVLTDGGESRGTTSAGQAIVVPLGAISEFKLETANYSAEFGRAAGGIIQIATKSGTNEYHGEVYEFLRNDNLNANSWSNNRNSVARGQFQRNQFGAALGGPVVRDRTFFFFNYEGIREGTPIQFLSTVPTQREKQGDFSQTLDRNGDNFRIYDFLTTRPDGAGGFVRDQFPNNQIPAGRIDPVSSNILPFWPAANRPGQGPANVNNYFTSGKNVGDVDSYFGRVDHVITDKHRFFGRIGITQNDRTPTGIESIAFPSRSTAETPTDTELISLTSMFSPTVLGELRFSHARIQQNNTPLDEGFDAASLGFSRSFTENILFPSFPEIRVQSFASGTGLSVSAAPPSEVGSLGGASKNVRAQDTWQAQYHLTVMKDRHKMKMGVDLQLIRLHPFNTRNPAGEFFFDRVYSQGPDPSTASLNGGHGFASFLLGVPINGSLTNDPRLRLWQKYYGGYFQDDIRLTKNLTLNLGVRYEYLTPFAEVYGQVGYFDREAIEPISGGKGAFQFIEPNGFQSNPEKKKFAPRVGLAYQMDSKTVIRAAGAIFYAANNGINAASSDFGNGAFIQNTLSLGPPNPLPFTPPVNGNISNPFAGGILQPSRDSTFVGENVRADTQDHPLAYVSNWSLSIQRMVKPTMLVEVAYVGSQITNQFWNRHHNQNNPLLMSLGSALLEPVENPFFGKIQSGPLSFPTVQRRQLLRPFPHFRQVLLFRDPYASSNYQSFTARVEKRYTDGLTFTLAYTGSKAINGIPESNSWLVGPNNSLYDPNYNRSLDANDATHRFVLSYIYDLPLGKGRPYLSQGPLSWVLGNWQLAGITVLQSGRPIAITAPDVTNLHDFRFTHGRGNRLHSGVLSDSEQTLDRWFDISAFEAAAPFTLPNDSLTQPDLRTPKQVNFDMSLIKNVPIKERYSVQFRAEFFNIFNTPLFEVRGAAVDVSSSQFGRILEGGGNRRVQLALRFSF